MGIDSKDRIDVTGLDKYELIAALCNGARPLGMGAFNPKARDSITANDVYEYIEERQCDEEVLMFDYLFGRPLKIQLSLEEGKLLLDGWRLYDRDAGKGAAMNVIKNLRRAGVKVTKKICNANGANCPCGLKPTPEGHDGCLGTIEGAMNACCGHLGFGDGGAYIQYGELIDGRWVESSRIGGKDALAEFDRLGIGPDMSKWDDRPCECSLCEKVTKEELADRSLAFLNASENCNSYLETRNDAHQNETKLPATVLRQERFARAVHIYAMYMAVTEGIDRSYPHLPVRLTYMGLTVQPKRHALCHEQFAKIRELNDTKNHLIHLLELSDADDRFAFNEAGLIATRALDECHLAKGSR